ncbi:MULTISPECIES: hypothetical protein [unclassified Ruegeria]|uniref:hypothetical protein n=1 Tax=unclassified Ruegeria TaxID=2625375 RepID=UPI001490D7D2|nr:MULTISPECIES: hypothetical protein [unclassified Ruegeria]NOD37129.1 hypothetical protein [Ruegeria sp. HKCCD7296]NOE44309.1 hypothetical protein [Ruegeria sp. HKCCD7319]
MINVTDATLQPASQIVRLLKGLVSGITLVSSLVWTSPAVAADVSQLPPGLQAKVDLAAQACAEFNDGQFDLDWGAVERVDLDGDLRRDWVPNESGFACSSAASLYCGTGGCMSHFLIEEEVHSLLNRGWTVVEFGRQRIVLADVHGTNCDGINPTPCATASVWDAEAKTWRSSAGDWE